MDSMRTHRSDHRERPPIMPDSLEPEVSPEVQAPASAAATSWDDVSPQLPATRETEIPRPTEPMDQQRPADPGAPPTKPLSGLTAQSISAWFGDHKVLDRVSLTMEPGTVTALIGPSGCGKSTFLRILNRMHEMVAGASLGGEVLLGSDDIYSPGTRPSDVRRKIGMVFQKPNPFPAMSIYDNVASGLKLAGIKVANKDALVEVSLRRAGPWNEVRRRMRAPGGGLSGGQQQRLCIARALAVSPDVLLM